MKGKNILVFGGSGQIGRHLIRRLTKNNHMVTAVTRNLHQKGYVLKTQGNPGYLDVIEENIFDEEKLNYLLKNKDICINLIGILFEKRNNTFQNIHVNFPSIISKICKKNNIQQFVHISALGIEEAIDSDYAKSKLEGEKLVKENFEKTTILKPSIVFSQDDDFSTKFLSLLNLLPFFPLYYNGNTKFIPIHVSDLTEIIYQVISKNITATTIECIGPEIISLKEILQRLLKIIDKKRLLIPLPIFIARLSAKFLQLFPKPLLTLDQLNLLKYDNVASSKYKNNFDIGIPSIHMFDIEVEKYAFMWKDAGQFSSKKHNLN